MGEYSEMRRPHVVEPAAALWSEAALIGAGAAIGALGLFLLPTVTRKWPTWYAPAAGLALLPLALRRKVPPWAPVASAALAMAPGWLIHSWPWHTPLLAGAIAGAVAFALAAFVIAAHHRGLIDRALAMLERIDRPSLPMRQPTFVYAAQHAPEQDARWTAEAEADEAAELAGAQAEAEAGDLAYVVNRIWPAEPNGYRMGTDLRTWLQEPLPSGLRMTRGRWRATMEMFERAQLVRRANPDSRAPFVATATRGQVLQALRELLPKAGGDE